jgi:hypothetical protein
MKKCSICKEEKDPSEFKKDKRRKDGCSSHCKSCLRIKGLEYYHSTKISRSEKIKENRKRSYNNNREAENESSSKYKSDNKELIKNYNKSYHEKNKEVLKELSIEYRKENKERIKKYSNNYIMNRLKSDNLFKLSHYTRSMIRKSFKRNGYSKSSKTQEILGCSFEDFKTYLESKFEDWMTWENKGKYNKQFNYGWDIDHIIPSSSAKSEDEVIRLNHYTNLQPLCSKINRDIKRDSI